MKNSIAFVWENFGPTHADRCEATAKLFEGRRTIVGIELGGTSEVYGWRSESGTRFEKVTLFPQASANKVGHWARYWVTLQACVGSGASDVFLCHYQHLSTLLTAISLRILGRRVYVMNDSKFDDYERSLWREVGKSFFYFPYVGGIASGKRSIDYLRFLGLSRTRLRGNYNAVGVERIRLLAGSPPAPEGHPFAGRHFTMVARFVTKKNHLVAIDAYDAYRRKTEHPRMLHLCGSGPLEGAIRSRVAELGLEQCVRFHGFVQTEEVCKILANTLALLLPSIEEQFGNAVLEAFALGVPAIVGENCGVRDQIVRSGVNGFVIEPDNVEGMAYFMSLLADDEALWRRMSRAAHNWTHLGDASHFAEAVRDVIGATVGNRRRGR